MKNVLVFHNDFDGVVSAALLLKSFPADDSYVLVPASYSPDIHKNLTKKLDRIIGLSSVIATNTNVIIVDFAYHSFCGIWIDHHIANKIGPKKCFEPDKYFDSSALSCVGLVARYIREQTICKPFKINKELLIWADKIDGARYETPDEIFNNDDNPYIQLNMYIQENSRNDGTMCRMVELLVKYNMDVKKVVDILGSTQHLINCKNEKLKVAKNAIALLDNRIAILEQRPSDNYPRYLELFACPDIYYSLRITHNKSGMDKIQVGANMFKKSPVSGVNIGAIMRNEIRGGGHRHVGSGFVHSGRSGEVVDKLTEILFKAINEKEGRMGMGIGDNDEMEKNAVDENDLIEKKAIEIEKTGGSTIEEGREEVVKEEADNVENNS